MCLSKLQIVFVKTMFIYKSKVAPTALRPGAVNFISLLCVYNLHCHRPPHIFKEGAIPVNHLEVEKIRLQSAPRPHLLVPAMPKSFAAPRKWAGKDC